MIHHKVEQGSEAWHALRLGIPTATGFGRIMTPKTLKLAASRDSYRIELLTERILGVPLDNFTTEAMQNGHDWEPKARAAYEMDNECDVELCGFCSDDAKTYGASPDGFVGEDGSLEIKCPFKPQIHIGYLMEPESLRAEYYAQVQGQLFVTGRKWTDLISYFSTLPTAKIRIYPDPTYQAALAESLKVFLAELQASIELATEKRWIKS